MVKQESPGLSALRDMRSARRRRLVEKLEWFDVLYRVYVAAIFGVWGLALISGALADATLSDHSVNQVGQHAPALIGLVIALAIVGGLRSGARGGPLAIQPPEVQYVLMAPIDRGIALRASAIRQLRTGLFAGAVTGAIIGNFAFRRLPGTALEWIACLAVFASVVPLWTLSSAMFASGRRFGKLAVFLIAVPILAWSAADILRESTTSPATLLGELAIWPIHEAGVSFVLPLIGLAVAAITTAIAIRGLGGLSLEAARHRASLAAQLRFAVTLQDLRTVILLRRQLASETPRRRPWLRLSHPRPGSNPIWRRDWHSFMRWPSLRVLRISLCGVVAGLSICAAWQGTTPLVVVAGLALLFAAFDAVEPLAQEVDHPTILDLLPVRSDKLIRSHLVAPTVVMFGVCMIATATALFFGPPSLVLGVGLGLAVPTALLMLCCAALSATNDPYAYLSTPAVGYAQSIIPIVVSIIGVGVPILVAREAARHGQSAAGAAIGVELNFVIICVASIWWLGRRIAKRSPVTQ